MGRTGWKTNTDFDSFVRKLKRTCSSVSSGMEVKAVQNSGQVEKLRQTQKDNEVWKLQILKWNIIITDAYN